LRKDRAEKAYVLGIHTRYDTRYHAQESLEEAKNLVITAGAELTGNEFVEIRQFHPATFFGQGKVEEVKQTLLNLKPDVVIVDHELSSVQVRNLENTWCTRVIDRTELILDIFAQRAESKEGKLQVELAQYQYLLPRLVGAWTHFSKQKGGIGLRGPGETQLEVDRRRVRERIAMIKKNLKKVISSRQIHREKRLAVPIPTISLVGYTNAGKTTLFNQISGATELAENKLFATLDPKTRKIRLPSGQKILMSDTVGFIRNLPHQLVDSFTSTFEEVAASGLLLHVIDVSHPDRAQQIETVENLISDLGLSDKPIIRVMNKVDRLDEGLEGLIEENSLHNVIKVSALENMGINTLLSKIEDKLSQCYYRRMNLLIPHADGKILNELYTHCSVISSTNTPQGAQIEVNLPPKWQALYGDYEVA